MSRFVRGIGAVITGVIAGTTVSLVTAAGAGASPPKCTDVGSNLTYCETNGSTQLQATPPPWNWGGWQGGGYPFGGFGFGYLP